MENIKNLFPKMLDNERRELFFNWYKLPIEKDKISGFLYTYKKNKWELLKDDDLKNLITDFLNINGINWRVSWINNLADTISITAPKMGETNSDLIGFQNIAFNKVTGQPQPHKKEDYIKTIIPIIYSENDNNLTNFNKWINWAAENDTEKKDRILAALYMVLMNRYEWQLFLEITGKGGTGKSVFNEIAIMLVGRENSVSIGLKELSDPRMNSGIVDKALIYSPDQGRTIQDGSKLKNITSGMDTIQVKPLYKKDFNYQPKSIYLMTNNEPVIFTEKNSGIERRRVLFRFDNQIPENQRDINLIQKIESELPAIINLLVRRFPISPSDKKGKNEAFELLIKQRDSEEAHSIKIEGDHLLQFAQFFDTKLEIKGLKPGKSISADEISRHNALYSVYLIFCNDLEIKNYLKLSQFKPQFENAINSLNKIKYREIKTGGNYRTNVYLKFATIAEAREEWAS